MALSAADLESEIISAVKAAVAAADPEDAGEAVWGAVAEAVVDHLKSNAEVTTANSDGSVTTTGEIK